MNILLLSAGTRNQIVRYFKQTLNGSGSVVATDMNPYAPALYDADSFYIVPRISEPGYIDIILDICKKEAIDGVLSLIDPELSILAAHTDEFKVVGTTVIGSSYALCEMALDKMQMFNWLTANGFPCARSYTTLDAFYADRAAGKSDFPVFVKPIRGSASMCVSKVGDPEMLELLFAQTPDLMIQAYLQGEEIGADVYIDMISGKVVSIFTKIKLAMRAGETDKAISFKDPALFALITAFAEKSGYRGQIDIDLFRMGDRYTISEVNPRFGGGYPHAFVCGVNHMKMIINNLSGVENKPAIGCYEDGVVMMKYSEIAVTRMKE